MLERENEIYDVIVVGGGGSGLAAAATAAETGARVLLLEKSAQLGGSTALSIGSITATRTSLQRKAGIIDSPQDHFEDMPKFAESLAVRDNSDLRRVLAENVGDTVEWLTSLGLTFFGPMPEPPHRKPRMHNVLPNSRAYIFYLERHCRRLKVAIHTTAQVHELLNESGRVVGVIAEIAGRHCSIKARKGVILACGDFSAARELNAMYHPELSAIDALNPVNTGDALRMTQSLAAVIRNGELVLCQLRFVAPPTTGWMFKIPPVKPLTKLMRLVIDYAPNAVLRPFILSFVTTFLAPEASLFREGAVLINARGERFTDERKQPHIALGSQPGKEGFIVFDRKLARQFSAWPFFISTAPGVAYAYLPDYQRNRKDLFHQGTSWSDLARSLGICSQRLTKTMTTYNGTEQDRGDRPPLLDAPYYALGPVRSWIILTDGGLAVSKEHEVLRQDGSKIPGLYAVGSTGQGGLLLEGHGHHLAWAFTSGRLAGRYAASSPCGRESVTANG